MNPTTSADALTQLQQTQAQSQDPNAILSGQRQQLGVDAANQTVTGLRGAINNTTTLLQKVAPSVMGRTANSLVTNAQATRQIANEQAPINQTLSDQTSKESQAEQDANLKESQAEKAASGIYQGQQDKQSYLQNIYNTLYGKEQDAAKAAEQEREFNAQLSASKSSASSGGIDLGSLFGGGSGTQGGGFQMQQRGNGGFNFQDANGGGSNAVAFSQAKGVPVRTLLQQMANAGDSGAKTALNYVGNDYGVNTNKLRSLEVSPNTYNATVSLLHALGFRV